LLQALNAFSQALNALDLKAKEATRTTSTSRGGRLALPSCLSTGTLEIHAIDWYPT
jgi:hypothetical protein